MDNTIWITPNPPLDNPKSSAALRCGGFFAIFAIMLAGKLKDYEERLAAVASTRLLFNTIAELEEFLGTHALRSNGIRRCFSSPQRLRAAYRDCNGEVEEQTSGRFDLGWLMRNYLRADLFYKQHLARRKEPEALARKVLEYHYGLAPRRRLSKTLAAICGEIDEAEINLPLLVLLLLKAIPGYDSKSGDVTDIDSQFARVLDFLGGFTAGCGGYDVLPVIKLAGEEPRRTRLMLIFHTINILDTYENYFDDCSMARTSDEMKGSIVNLTLDGFWAENAAQSSSASSDFWELEHASNSGTYFATRYERQSSRLLLATRYTLHLFEFNPGILTAFFLHPLFIKHRIKGIAAGDQDNAWYTTPYPETDVPGQLSLVRSFHSDFWPSNVNLNRVSDPARASRLANEIKRGPVIEAYEECNYTFFPGIYAITQQAVYILDDEEECFYKLPRFTEHCFETIALDDNVGIFTMGGNRYLCIDERLLYIPLTPRSLRKYAIEKVREIT